MQEGPRIAAQYAAPSFFHPFRSFANVRGLCWFLLARAARDDITMLKKIHNRAQWITRGYH